jgi:TolB protein
MGRRCCRGLGAAVAFAAALVTLGGGVAHATFPGRNGRIAFSDFVSRQIYAVNPDGSGLAQLTHTGPNREGDTPSWSPNGRRLVFAMFNLNKGQSRIWVMNANGSHERRVASPGKRFVDQTPTFTPDGRHIVFSRCRDVCGIWKMRANGTHQRALTPFRDVNETVDNFPSVAPNGRRIAFTRFLKGGIEARIFLMRRDGTHAHAVTPWRLEAGTPSWKPNGRRIAFTSNEFRTGSSIFTMRPNGDGIHRLTPDRYPHNDALPAYSPRGNRIAFISDRNYTDACCTDLFEIDADGSAEQLIDTGFTDTNIVQPTWGTHPLAP